MLTQCCVLYLSIYIHMQVTYAQAQICWVFMLCKSGMPLLIPIKSQYCKIDMFKGFSNLVFCIQRHT